MTEHTEERTETHACDSISRRAAIDAVGSMLRRKFGIGGDLAEITLAGLPSTQPERKTGRWVSVGCVVPDIANVPMIKCTVCGHLEPDVDAARTPYCSHCGAYMKGENDG